MRPIDGDKIGLTDFEIIMCDGDYKKALEMLLQKIEDAPTLKTTIHTKYTPDGKCANCKRIYLSLYDSYCPNCGAKIDREE